VISGRSSQACPGEERAGLGFFHYVHEDLHVGGVAGEEAVEFNAYIVHLVGNCCVF